MDYEAIRGGLAQAVPFNAHVGLEVTEVGPGTGIVRLPDRDELRNHVGSQHAGALFAAGEAASGAAFVGGFAERLGDIMPLAQKAEIVYRRLARGVITARGRLDSDPEALLTELDEDGQVRFAVDVVLEDGEGELVAEMTVDWTVKRTA
jgi:acyl-coenzyme A thioesterase PaaI-like protein